MRSGLSAMRGLLAYSVKMTYNQCPGGGRQRQQPRGVLGTAIKSWVVSTMSISHLLVRLLLVPLGAVLAGCAATLVAFLANWKVFQSVIGGDAMTSGDIVAVMVGLAML